MPASPQLNDAVHRESAVFNLAAVALPSIIILYRRHSLSRRPTPYYWPQSCDSLVDVVAASQLQETFKQMTRQ
ncbi:hypothetical protein FA10DRAFT_89492 [Acaromyces ingoldii]|uniref:Uncharacterized protein n=1 Tax=Acaromyces ingoldii TaxID=215250 RepID=A0A316YSC9_9BASI|nr:hypothetical protein FA10DRAFT_89492 [Acaromyces ingoldii]PWN92297.1 hypothetical protein FA10DRAFT_89492 [Acaromyces ingoldii]